LSRETIETIKMATFFGRFGKMKVWKKMRIWWAKCEKPKIKFSVKNGQKPLGWEHKNRWFL